MRTIGLAACLASLLAAPALAQTPVPAQASAGTLRIVAAENFYGDVARQLGGPHVTVVSILSNPNQDPHLFEVSPSVARELAGARIVVYSGADYDPWMARLLATGSAARRRAIDVAGLVGRISGDNPHIWYDPPTMPALARALSTELVADDPAHAAEYRQRLDRFNASLEPLRAKVAAVRKKWSGTPVTATEPVFGYMATALGLAMRNYDFQIAVMNNTEPSASQMAAFEGDLRGHRVRLLAYNSQVTDDSTARLLAIARRSGIPVIGVTETEPAGTGYQAWMLDQIDALDRALSASGA